MWRRDRFTISTDPAHLDREVIWRYLHDESYWANGIPRDLFERSLERSLNFGLSEGEPGAGATVAWLCDVFVLPAYGGRGLATWLMDVVTSHPDLQVQRSFVLATRDAHGLYEKFGWKSAEAGRFMRIARPYRT